MRQMRTPAVLLCFLAFVVTFAVAPAMVFGNPLNPLNQLNPFAAPPLEQPVGWRSGMLGERVPTRRQVGLDIRGTFPYINSAFPAASFINQHIDDYVVTSLITEARRLRARAITFDMEYRPTEDVVSIVILADVATTLPHTLVRSVNFCAHTGRILDMAEATGMEILPLAERILAEKIRGNPERYYAALNSEMPEAFYLTDESLAILFDGFALSTRVSTHETIELFFENIYSFTLEPDGFRPNGPYGLKMIPVMEVLVGRLGYEARTIRGDDRIRRTVISRDGVDLIAFALNDSEYLVHGTQRRTLEVAPQLLMNQYTGEYRTYVPITFFDQVLPNTTYTIGWDESITFLAYFWN